MRLVCTLIGIAAAVSLQAQAAPYMEAREAIGTKMPPSRGVAAYGVFEDGTRWFYSRAWIGQSQDSETTIKSWSKPDGTPIRAIYTAKTRVKVTVTTVTVKDGEAKLVERTEMLGSSPRIREATVKVEPGTMLQMSQFNPLDIKMEPGQDSVALTIVDPVEMKAIQATLRLVVSGTRRINGQAVGQENRYVLDTENGQNQIRVDGNGLLIGSLNSQGLLMRPVELLPEERTELLSIASTMRGN